MKCLPYIFLIICVVLISAVSIMPQNVSDTDTYNDYTIVFPFRYGVTDAYVMAAKSAATPVRNSALFPNIITVRSNNPVFIETAYANGALAVTKSIVNGACILSTEHSFIKI